MTTLIGSAIRILLTISIVATVGSARIAKAEDVKAVKVDGVEGFFVPSATFRQLYRDRRELDLAKQQLVLQQDLIQTQRQIIQLKTTTASISKALAVQWYEGWETERAARLAEKRSDWEPLLWVGATVGAVIGIALALKPVR